MLTTSVPFPLDLTAAFAIIQLHPSPNSGKQPLAARPSALCAPREQYKFAEIRLTAPKTLGIRRVWQQR